MAAAKTLASLDVLANDSDEELDALTITAVGTPSKGGSPTASFSKAFNGGSGNGTWRLRLATLHAVSLAALVVAELKLTYDAL